MSNPALTIAGTAHALRWSLLARYRLQSLPISSNFGDLLKPERAVHASINFGWACLPAEAGISSPEALVAAIEAKQCTIADLDEALCGMIDIAFPQGPTAESKKASTDSSPMPASNSG